MSSFLWLLIINYNLWKAFENIGIGKKNRFMKYNIFVWSMVTILFAITALAESTPLWISELGKFEELTPDFALDCWINSMQILLTYVCTHCDNCLYKASRLSASIYFYGPMLTLILINIVLFIKTVRRIIVQNRDNRRQLKRSQSQRQLRNSAKYVYLGWNSI